MNGIVEVSKSQHELIIIKLAKLHRSHYSFILIICLKFPIKKFKGAGEMAQRTLAALGEDPDLLPSTHIGHLTSTCNSSLKDLMPSSLSRYLHKCGTHKSTNVHTFFNLKKKLKEPMHSSYNA